MKQADDSHNVQQYIKFRFTESNLTQLLKQTPSGFEDGIEKQLYS